MSRKIRVLVVDDNKMFRDVVADQLNDLNIEATPVESGEEALKSLREIDCDVMLLDINMGGISGLDALRQIRRIEDAPEVIMLTADTSLSTGIEAMRLGAYDYLTKPATLDEMEAVIRKADEKRRLVKQNASLRSVVRQPTVNEDEAPTIIYQSAMMRGVVELAETAARLDSTVIVTGESGTGKDVLARFIHARSARADSPLITVNCGALPESLFESEFFGHEKGAFTGASTLKRGLIEAADGSTLFLDEVGEMPLSVQVKLLHFLEQGRFRRVGSTKDQTVDVRVIAATNRHLQREVREGRFRADLFYRLNVVSLHILPLRERPADIPALIEYFFTQFRQRFNRPALTLSEDARQRLETFSWPGNIRELRNCLERAAALSTTDTIEVGQLMLSGDVDQGLGASESQMVISDSQSPPVTLDELERQHIMRVLSETGGNRERTAAILGISARTLYRKLREYETGAGSSSFATEA
ncbi:MAG: two-component system, NtrC family, response regulator AtoC [Acidobacteriota bacterium]|jgi:DNA-binding NtrC family response regulator|nr:two-component system, NtrC family, response regulator AtoC [Acidobacteriota bacterium]